MEQDKAFKLSDDGKELIKYEGDYSIVVIPEGVETIKWRAFEKNDCIKKVVLPSPLSPNIKVKPSENSKWLLSP